MNLIDIHAHLEHERFKNDLDKVIERAEKAGVKFIINSGVNPETNRKALELSKKYSIVKASFGLYPVDSLIKEVELSKETENAFLREIKEFDVDSELKWIEQHKNDCVAIGEIGLDYNWPDFQTPEIKEKQKQVLIKIIKLANQIKKPIIIHSRKAELDAIEILEKEAKGIPVIMHCFSGKKSLIKRCVDNKWFLSVPPVITRLLHFQTLVEIVPLNQLLTETDAPYLSPVQGQRNEPANVSVTINEIARIKKISEEKVAETIYHNAENLFKI